MKTIKILLTSISAIVLLVIGTVAFLLSSPAAQTYLVSRLVLPEARIDKVHLGARGLLVEGFSYSSAGADIYFERLEADFSLIEVLKQRSISIARLNALGVIIELNAVDEDLPAKEVAIEQEDIGDIEKIADQDFFERLEYLEIPWDRIADYEGFFQHPPEWPPVTVAELFADVKIFLSCGIQTLNLNVSGSDLDPSGTPVLVVDGNYESVHDVASLSGISGNAHVGVKTSDSRQIVGVEFVSVLMINALVDDVYPSEMRVDLCAGIKRNELQDGEDYRLVAKISTEDGEDIEAFLAESAYCYLDRSMKGSIWSGIEIEELGAISSKIAHGSLISAGLSADFEINPTDRDAMVEAKINLVTDNLGLLIPQVGAVSGMDAQADLKASASGNTIRFDRLVVSLALPAEDAMMEVRSQQPFSIDMDNQIPVFDDPDKPMLLLSLNGLPTDLINSHLPETEIQLTDAKGEMAFVGQEGDFRLHTANPLLISGLSVKHEGKKLVEHLDMSISKSMRYAQEKLHLVIDVFELAQNEATIFRGELSGDFSYVTQKIGFDLESNISADMARLLNQPVLSQFNNVARGSLRAELSASGTLDDTSANVNLVMNELRSASAQEEIEAINMNVDVALSDDFRKIVIGGPFNIRSRGFETDFTSDLQIATSEEGAQVLAEIEGESLSFSQLEVLASLFRNPDFPPSEPPIGEEVDSVLEAAIGLDDAEVGLEPSATDPVWAGLTANLRVNLNRIELPDGLLLGDTELLAVVQKDSVSIKNFRTLYGGSAVDATGELAFRSEEADSPYSLSASVSASGFDVGKFLREVDPSQESALDAIVDMQAEIRAQAAVPEKLTDAIVGDIAISASQGIFRALRRGAVSDVIETASLLGQLGGVLTGQQDVEAVSQLTSYFNAIAFDNLEIEARRNADLSFEVMSFLLSNADLMLRGRGWMGNDPERRFYEQPIELLVSMGVKPPVRHIFKRLNLLESIEDGEAMPRSDEYWALRRQIELRGSITKPDPSEFWRRILEASARQLLDRRREDGERSRDAAIREIRGVLGL